MLENLRQTARVLDEKGIEQVAVSSDPDVLGVAATPVRIPFAVDERQPFVHIVAGQLMAHARRRPWLRSGPPAWIAEGDLHARVLPAGCYRG